MAFSAVKTFGRPRRAGHTYEIEIVAQYCAELPPGVAFAGFQWKRSGRLSVADAVPVLDGAAEWNTLCKQTCTLCKNPSGAGGWRPKEFVFKVRSFDRAGSYQHGRTVAKAALDLSSFCMAEPFGPRQMTIPLRPQGLLTVSVRTQWLHNYDCDADALTDISYLSAAPTATTALDYTTDEQDLEGFDQLSIKAVYPHHPSRRGPGSTGSADSSRTGMAGRLPLQEASMASQQQQQQVQARGGKASPGAWTPGAFAGFVGAASAAKRRPQAVTPLRLGGLLSEGGECGSAPTPTLILGGRAAGAPVQQLTAPKAPAMGLPEEQWSPIDLDQARAKLQSSDEEDEGDMASERWRMRPVRSFRRWLSNAPDPDRMATPATEATQIDRETSISALKRRCRQLLVERDEARAESYAAQSEALRRAVELDNLARTKAMLAERLATTEAQLMAMCKDEASSGLVAALVAARVAAADSEFAVLQLKGDVRKYKAEAESLRAKLTRMEAQYRLSLHSLTSSRPSGRPRGLPGRGPRRREGGGAASGGSASGGSASGGSASGGSASGGSASGGSTPTARSMLSEPLAAAGRRRGGAGSSSASPSAATSCTSPQDSVGSWPAEAQLLPAAPVQ